MIRGAPAFALAMLAFSAGAQVSPSPSVFPTPSPKASAAKSLGVEVVAIVAERVVTDRQVLIDLLLKRPDNYRVGLRPSDLSKTLLEGATQGHILELMILEDNRLVGREAAGEVELRRSLQSLQRRLGDRYRAFLRDFELTEADVREKLSQHIVVDSILETRVKGAGAELESRSAGKKVSAADREAAGRKALEDWVLQLKARYRVQRLNVDRALENVAPTAKAGSTP